MKRLLGFVLVLSLLLIQLPSSQVSAQGEAVFVEYNQVYTDLFNVPTRYILFGGTAGNCVDIHVYGAAPSITLTLSQGGRGITEGTFSAGSDAWTRGTLGQQQLPADDMYEVAVTVDSAFVNNRFTIQIELDRQDGCEPHSDPMFNYLELGVPVTGNPFSNHYYVFTADAEEILRYKLDGNGIFGYVIIRDFENGELIHSFNGIGQSNPVSMDFPYIMPRTTTYQVEVSFDGGYGEYTLEVYRGELAQPAEDDPDGYIEFGETVTGEFLPLDSEELWTAHANANGRTYLLFRGEPHLNPTITVTKTNGEVTTLLGSIPEPGIFYTQLDPSLSGHFLEIRLYDQQGWFGNYELTLVTQEIPEYEQVHILPEIPQIYNHACSPDGVMYFTLHIDFESQNSLVENGVLSDISVTRYNDEEIVVMPYSEVFGEFDGTGITVEVIVEGSVHTVAHSIPFVGSALHLWNQFVETQERAERNFVESYRFYVPPDNATLTMNTETHLGFLNMVILNGNSGGVTVSSTWNFYDPESLSLEPLETIVRNQYISCGGNG